MATRPQWSILASVVVAFGVSGCAGSGSTTLGPTPTTSVSPVNSAAGGGAADPKAAKAPQATRSLAAVHTWTEVSIPPDAKPDVALTSLSTATEDLLIFDPTIVPAASPSNAKPTVSPAAATGTAAVAPVTVASLQQSGRRRVLAILDLSTLATNSPLWQAGWVDPKGKLIDAAPKWLDASDKTGSDTYVVKYWDADWQKRLMGYQDKLLAAGYDGFLLSGVDAYVHVLKAHPSAGVDMATLVKALADHARKAHPNTAIVVDGAVALSGTLKKEQAKSYLAALDGVLAHDVFYPGDQAVNNTLAPQPAVLAALDAIHKADKVVFVTERLTDPDKIADFVTRAKSNGWLPDSTFLGAAKQPDAGSSAQVAANPR